MVEKRFVNDPEHTQWVARHGQQLLARIDLKPGWKYLDVGCGVGAAACGIANRFDLVITGIDVDPKQIEEARSRSIHPDLRFMTMDAARMQFRPGEFDIVATSMATHHIPEWERVFSEMVRVLRPGGYLIYTDLMFPSWLSAAGGYLIPFVGLPSRKRLEALAAQEGLVKIFEGGSGMRSDFIWQKEELFLL
jgi:ubiquinone/menaquinone biosynthesis C-methylase UbiE